MKITLIIYLVVAALRLTGARASDFFGGGNPFQGAFYGSSRGSSRSQDSSLYDLLGVDRGCSDVDIKKAYRRQARLCHPDKGGDAETFKKLSEAYEVLADEERRANYNRYGMAGVEGAGRGGGAEFTSASDFARELFRGFGGGGGFPGAAFGNPFSMPLVFQLDLSLEDLYKGREIIIPIQNIRVSVNIQPGMSSGQELVLKGQFHDERGQARDLVFRLREVRHPRFQRKNADLLCELNISLREALFGFERSIELLDGDELVLASKEGDILNHNDCLLVEDIGMPVWRSDNERGRLFVVVKLTMPETLAALKKGSGQKEDLQYLLGILDGTQDPSSRPRADKGGHGLGHGAASNPNLAKRRKKGITEDGRRIAELQRSDLGYFGHYGATYEDDEGDSPFSRYFFR